MALRVHMTVEGTTQGLITEACSRRAGREDTVELVTFDQEILIPWNEETSDVTGHTRCKPVQITKEIDRCSALLQKALVSNEKLTVTLQFFRFDPSGVGKEEHFYTILLEEATVVNYHGRLFNTLDKETAKMPAIESVGYAFRSITVTYEPNGIQYNYNMDNT